MVHQEPKISAAKLAEYITASLNRRRTILFQQAEPPVHIVDRYGPVSHALARATASQNPDILSELTQKYREKEKTAENEPRKQRYRDAQSAIAACLEVGNLNFPTGSILTRLSASMPALNIAGVSVSVRPELLVKRDTDSAIKIGCAKFYISKTHPLNEDAQQTLGALLHWYAEEHLGLWGAPDSRLCKVVSVFDRQVSLAPRSYKKRRQLITVACEEIADRWPRIVEKILAVDAVYAE